LRDPGLLGNWLYGVAYRTAIEARARAARARGRERRAQDMAQPEPAGEAGWGEVRTGLGEEVGGRPGEDRGPPGVCCRQGKTHRAAAQALGVSSGSMSSRLAKARELLRQRLVKRGVALSAAALAAALSAGEVWALVPAPLVESTVRAGLLFGADGAAAAA